MSAKAVGCIHIRKKIGDTEVSPMICYFDVASRIGLRVGTA